MSTQHQHTPHDVVAALIARIGTHTACRRAEHAFDGGRRAAAPRPRALHIREPHIEADHIRRLFGAFEQRPEQTASPRPPSGMGPLKPRWRAVQDL